ncbi:MAG: serine/threonine-protein kinase [Acidobacteriota bacterium]|nr:serine/threonine-protein kinase [Acidobacteriota bacterium]
MNNRTSIAHYRITAKIGEGGMGEVYRATDTKLNREVAIKVLPEAFANDPDRLARFAREAQVLAALNHPNIASIYGVEELAIVTELVDGSDLKGPLSLETALEYAGQIADALEAAHEKGITHRDLKPANIKITPQGVVKVLDFGLAKIAESNAASGSLNNSPTLTIRGSESGMILGTAAYMAPEQARGKAVDKRADIWAFGVVLWEMLTGRQMFVGDTVSDVLASVLRNEPDLGAVPAQVRPLLAACLEKDPRKRLRDIGDWRRQMAPEHIPATAPARRRNWLPWTAAGLACVLAALCAAWLLRTPEQQPILELSAALPEEAALSPWAPAISPDGRHIVFGAMLGGKKQLWIRNLDELTPRALAGTEGAQDPFWSPDSRFVGFFADRKLKKIDIAGGPAIPLCDTQIDRGGTWSAAGVILFGIGAADPLARVPAEGGVPTQVTEKESAVLESHRWPVFLPDGRHFLFVKRTQQPEKGGLYAGDLESKATKRILPVLSNAAFVAPGFLLFVRDRTLMMQAFDVSRLEVTGEARSVAQQVDFAERNVQGFFSASQTGTLVFTNGVLANDQMTWFDRAGKRVGSIGKAGALLWVAISPNGETVAFDWQDLQSGTWDVWTHDLAHNTDSRVTSDPANDRYPVWSPDGRYVVFSSNRSGKMRLYRKLSSGVGNDEVLLDVPNFLNATDWSRDGRFLFFQVATAATKTDIWVLPDPNSSQPSKPYPVLDTDFDESTAALSPDGHWLAYVSDRTRSPQVYLMSFPDKQSTFQISTNGGTNPFWNANGKELFYRAGDDIMSVDVQAGARFEHGVSRTLFRCQIPFDRILTRFAVHPDGKRFLVITPEQSAAPQRLNVIVNWRKLVR